MVAQGAPQPAVQQQPMQQRIVNVSEINPIMGGVSQHQHLVGGVQAAPAPLAAPTQAAFPQPQVSSTTVPTATPSSAASQPANGNSRQVSDRQQVLRHQQQRLLLLRHAAKCQHEDGHCPVTPHCAGMKRLWKHIAECKDQKCLVPHCVSSRYVLSHYHRCKDVRCPVCGPVREAIHRSHEKQKQMQAIKQRQQALQQRQVVPQAQLTPSASAPIPVAVPQPMSQAPLSAAPGVPSVEPPNKRQKIAAPMASTSSFPQVVQHGAAVGIPQQQMPQQQPLLQPSHQVPMPAQPGTPTAGYVYNQAVRPQVPGVAFSNGQVIMPKLAGPKPQEDHTLINCFSVEQIEIHIASLSKGLQLQPLKLKTKCLEVLKILQSHQHGWVFNTPVDPVELGLPDYFEVIKRPMDLGSIRKKLENGCYHSLEEFESHVNLTFENAMVYNPEGSVVYNMAKEMKDKFTLDYKNLIKQLEAEEDAKRTNGEACLLCGCEKLLFEPPVFYCNGMNCASKRIRRNSYYYVGGNNQYHWCHQCYQELRDGQAIELGDKAIKKEQLVKKKNDETHEESWVQCDRCERWVHQICALFNTRQNKDQRSEYACPRCTIEERRKKGNLEASSTTPMAEDLPRTKLSEHLESYVRVKVDEYLEKLARDKAAADVSYTLLHGSFCTNACHSLFSSSNLQGIDLEEAKQNIQTGGAITIRQVTSMDRKLEVMERMKRRYAFKNYPDEFKFRCKCIVVFQNLDGVDVILFGLYVYEHDETVSEPNKRTVYISYLDSVHFMRPRQMRTVVYHEILVSYLDYVRKRGFATAHIWACPPLKGDDYILYAKPEDQKTPKDDRLRQWYIDMLVEAQRRGIVGKVTNMYDLYFANERNDASVVPYMEGDYFPGEAENIIKDLEEGKNGKKASSQGKKKKEKAKQKKKSGRGGTRSTGLDEDALKASGFVQPGQEKKGLEDGGRDFVMVKLGETIQPMKESFIVAFLAWNGATPEQLVVPKAIQEYREKHGIICTPAGPHAVTENSNQTDITNGCGMASNESVVGTQSNCAVDSNEGQGPVQGSASSIASDGHVDDKSDANQSNSTAPALPSSGSSEAQPSDPAHLSTSGDATATSASSSSSAQNNAASIREGKFAAMAARKRDREGVPKPVITDASPENENEKAAPRLTVTDSKGREVQVIDDDLEEMDCEFLNNRQAFLNLCQGNHYQFDQLRRAKHSSMMVLWHLHNRDAPKFVQQCAICSREILAGYRYHCPTCQDFDICHECVTNPNTPRHPHQLKPIPIATGQQSELTEAQRKERQRSIQLHMTLLLHAATCKSPKCPSANCTKMKGLLKHGSQCQVKAAGGCNVCKRIWALLQLHARQCKATTCPVPSCMAIRERFRQLKKQQQAMDDRRRQEMNRVYRGVR